MGVHDLWQVLEPVARKVHLEELKGKVIAVDLSGWIVESQCVKAAYNTSKCMHLRNLFFRCSKLLGYGMDLVFVLEGDAPDIKGETLLQRSKLYCPEIRDSRRGGSRPGLRALSEQCRELLGIMGLHCVQSTGEAEATCATLNKKNLVDACMTEDSDVFLYGATLVYRGVVIDDKDPHVLEYRMSDIESQLNLTREKLIAVALLAGCDYFPGVPGVGKETAIKLFSKLGDINIIDRFKSWYKDRKFEELQTKLDLVTRKPHHCSVCHHPGTPKSHVKDGCEECKTEKQCKDLAEKDAECKCRWHETDAVKREWKLELDVRKKAMASAQFPPQKVIEEFLNDRNEVCTLEGSWKLPQLSAFQEYMQRMLYWEENESLNKLFPVLTRWHLLHMDEPCGMLKPEKIIKLRNIRSVPLYEVLWSQDNQEQDNDVSPPPPTTLEPQQLFKMCYPALVDEFLEEVNAKKATKKTSKSTKDIREFFKVKAKSSQESTKADPDDKKQGDKEYSVKEASDKQASQESEESQHLTDVQEERVSRNKHKSKKLTRLRQVQRKKPVAEPAAPITHFFGSTQELCADDSFDAYAVPLAERIRRKEVHDRPADTSDEKLTRNVSGLLDLEISIPKSPVAEVQSPTKPLEADVLLDHKCSPPKRKPTSPKNYQTETQFTSVRSPKTSENSRTASIMGKSARCLFPEEHPVTFINDSRPEDCSSPSRCVMRAAMLESTPIGSVTETCSKSEQSPVASGYDPSKSLFTSYEQSPFSRATHSIIVISDDEA